MKYLIYISTATKLMAESQLAEILQTARVNNTMLNITGMLVYSGGTFIQVIEGEETGVNQLFKKIELDTRHKNIIKLTDKPLTKRNFPDWSMGFVTVGENTIKELEGYINPANKNFLQTDQEHPAITILKTFAENNRHNRL